MKYCENIKEFTNISKLEKLEILSANETNIIDISFLEKNKNIKILVLDYCKNIKEFAQLEKLVILDVSKTNNKNIKELYMQNCKNIKKNDNLFSRKDIQIYI